MLRQIFLLACCVLAGCSSLRESPVQPPPPPRPMALPAPERPAYRQTGLASWYGADHQGELTASGDKFDQNKMVAAHRTLPFGTVVRITNLENGRTARVVINDRGPRRPGRIVDLSAAAAAALGFDDRGVVRVTLEQFASDQPNN